MESSRQDEQPTLLGLPEDPLASFNPDATIALGNEAGAELSDTGSLGTPPSNLPLSGTTSANYTLLRLAGEGGFGHVWEAAQTSLGRIVALKVIKSSFLDSAHVSEAKLVAASLRQEALTIAKLEHPNIVPIYDLGIDADERPLLAMKFARGKVWSDLIRTDFRELAPADFLLRHIPVLVDVAQAVAYAHSKGVIHRDIKPSQVMVGEYGEVLLMDWGLALDVQGAADLRNSAASASSHAWRSASNPAGTVAYMAPEQTDTTMDRIGPWTDVYLLGGTLYNLLTGLAPHPASDSLAAFNMARLGSVQAPAEACPGREMPPELISLATEALEADSKKRVKSADEFLHRLQDYVSGAGKRRESQQLTLHAAESLKTESGSYQQYTDLLSQLASARALWPGNPDTRPLREQTLEKFARSALLNRDLTLARVEAQQIAEPSTRDSLIQTITVRERAIASEARQRKVLFAAAGILLTLLVGGGAIYTRQLSVERTRVRAAAHRETAARRRAEDLMKFMLTDLNTSLEPLGKISLLNQVTRKALDYFASLPAEALSEESRLQRADALDAVGEVMRAGGDLDGASRAFNEAFVIRKELLGTKPEDAARMASLALSHNKRAKTFKLKGDTRAALLETAAARNLFQKAIRGGVRDLQNRRSFASTCTLEGEIHLAEGALPKALASFRTGRPITQKLIAEYPNHLEVKRDGAVENSKIGDVLDAGGDSAGALSHYRLYKKQMEELVARDPANLDWQRELAVAHNSVGWALRSLGSTDEALREFEQQRSLMQRLVEKEPANSNWQRELAFSEAVIGRVLRTQGRNAEAAGYLNSSRNILRTFSTKDPSNASWKRDFAVSQTLLGDALASTGETQKALQAIDESIAVIRSLLTQKPGHAEWKRDLAQFLRVAGDIRMKNGMTDLATRNLTESVNLMAPLTRDLKNAPVPFIDTHAAALLLLGRKEEARPLVEELISTGWKDPEFLRLIARNGFKLPAPKN